METAFSYVPFVQSSNSIHCVCDTFDEKTQLIGFVVLLMVAPADLI